jgi:O-antigen ligase
MIVALTPLYFNYFYSSSVELNKTVFFRVLLFFLLSFSVWQFAFYRLKFNKNRLIAILVPLVIFFASLVISLIFSVDFSSSWFGSYDRNEGLISYFFYGLWLIILLFNFNDIFNDNRLSRLLLSISVSASLVSIYAICQFFGFDFINWSEPAYITKRAFSSLGQPNYLACWLVMALPISAYLLYIAKNLQWRLVYGLFFILQLGALFTTGSRSAFLSFFIISLAWLFIFSLKEKKSLQKNIWKIFLVILISFISFIILLFVINPTRVHELGNFKEGSAGVRIELWQNGFKAFLSKPIFGYGLENQKEAYVKYYQPDFAIYARPNTYSDRAHNFLLDILLTGGLVGLSAFIYLMYSVFSVLWKTYQKNNNKFTSFY